MCFGPEEGAILAKGLATNRGPSHGRSNPFAKDSQMQKLLQHVTADDTTDAVHVYGFISVLIAVLLDLNLQHNNLSDVGTLAVTQALTEQAGTSFVDG